MTKRSNDLVLKMINALQASIERIERDCTLISASLNRVGEPDRSADSDNPPDTRTYFLDVRFSANEELLSFLSDLAETPRFISSTIAGTRPGHATVIVELAPAEEDEDDSPPTIRCIQCSTTIAFGSAVISHGLCPACVDDFLREARP